MRYAKIRKTDISNGPGIRVSIFVQGCHFHCKGCFNADTWDFNGGKEFTEDTLNTLLDLCKNEHIRGLSILGGEPLTEENRSSVLDIILEFNNRFPEKDIWMWTGYKFDDLLNQLNNLSKEPFKKNYYTLFNILNNLDVLVDGQFEIDKADPNLKYKGSANQRVIDVKKTLQNQEITLYNN